MVFRKSFSQKSNDKDKNLIHVPKGRKPHQKQDISKLQNVIVEGKLAVPLETEIIVEKKRDGKVQRSLCIIKKIEENMVSAWDETNDQWYLFNPETVEKSGTIIKVYDHTLVKSATT